MATVAIGLQGKTFTYQAGLMSAYARLPQWEFESHFDRMNGDERHHQNRNDICTPMGCVREMVGTIPSSFWRRDGLRILDPCAGNGNFHAHIRGFAPMSSLFFNEINEHRISNIKSMFGREAKISKRDFLLYDENNPFDLIVSNPPYAKFDKDGNRTSKNHNLARAFIKKAFRLTKPGGMILFIVPNNWMSYADRNPLPGLLSRHQFLHLNIHGAKSWFPKVGSSFTWFLVKKVRNSRPFTVENHYLWKETAKASLRPGVKYIPLFFNDIVDGIFAKTVDAEVEKQGILTSSDLHRYTKSNLIRERPSNTFCHKLIHTPTKTVWSKRPHKHQRGWKVFLSLTDRYGTFVDNCGMTQSVGYIRCNSKTEALERKKELDHPLFRFLNDLTRYGNFNNVRILQNLPRLHEVALSPMEKDFINLHWRNIRGGQ